MKHAVAQYHKRSYAQRVTSQVQRLLSAPYDKMEKEEKREFFPDLQTLSVR